MPGRRATLVAFSGIVLAALATIKLVQKADVWLGVTDADGLTTRAVNKGEQGLSVEILPSASSRVVT